ncbi:43 kDa receptor-associated protein of the synapse-like [Diadema antillarum]
MKLSLQQHDHLAQARCMCVFADVHRNRGDCERAFPRYESALNLMSDIGDRYGQILVLAGMTKALIHMKQPEKAIDFCNKAMEVATSIGNKMCMLRANWTLHTLYRAIGDMTTAQQHACRFDQYLQEMALYCGVCHEVMGNRENSIQSLTCFHIFHTRCVENSTFKTRGCPNCKKTAHLSTPVSV